MIAEAEHRTIILPVRAIMPVAPMVGPGFGARMLGLAPVIVPWRRSRAIAATALGGTLGVVARNLRRTRLAMAAGAILGRTLSRGAIFAGRAGLSTAIGGTAIGATAIGPTAIGGTTIGTSIRAALATAATPAPAFARLCGPVPARLS